MPIKRIPWTEGCSSVFVATLLAFINAATAAKAELAFQVYYEFQFGAGSVAGIIQGSDGNFYGTTSSSQGGGAGTIFKLSPSRVLTTFFSFNGTNGFSPIGGLTEGHDGNFYGTTYQGGASNRGTLFMITPGGNFMTLASFSGTNGAEPTANLVQGTDGHLYGTTLNGGMGFNGSLFSGFGTVFKITTNGVLETLVYLSSSNGIHPYDALVEGADGDFYGTASTGGTNSNSGSVFKVSANGAVTTIFYFNGANGSSPYAI